MATIQSDILPTAIEQSGGFDQRKHTRFVCVDGGVMRLSVRPEFRGRRAVLIDLSTGGIGFLLEEALECGAVMVFELQGPADPVPLTRIARVRHLRPFPTPVDAPWASKPPVLSKIFRGLLGMQTPKPCVPSWLIGCEFDKPLDAVEMQQFLDRLRLVQELGDL